MTILAWINEKTNVCDLCSLDPRPASEFQIPGYLILDLEAIGGGGIGDIWDGTKLVRPEPQPQPTSSGTQDV